MVEPQRPLNPGAKNPKTSVVLLFDGQTAGSIRHKANHAKTPVRFPGLLSLFPETCEESIPVSESAG